MDFRSGELAGVAVLGTAQHKNTIPNVFGPAHAKDCLLLQRFALKNVLELNAVSYFLARVRTLMKREGYCGIFADGIVLSNRSFSKLVNDESGWNYMARKFEIYGASKCPAAASERREWEFYWRRQFTRKQTNSGKLGYDWSLHPKVLLPKTLSYVRFRLLKLQRSLLYVD